MSRLKNIARLCGWPGTFVATLFFCSSLYAAPASLDLSAETAYSDNLSLTPDKRDNPLSGMHSKVSATLRKTRVVSESFSVLGEIGLGYHRFHIDHPADYWSANATIAANYRPFADYTAPYFKLSLSARRKEYNNEFHPDWNLRTRFSLNKQWSPRVFTSIGLAAREGHDEWPVVDTVNFGYWDTSQRELFLGMDWRFKNFIAYGLLSRTEGDLIWTFTRGDKYVGGLWADDSRIDELKLGVNFPVSSSGALDVLARFSQVSFKGQKMHDESGLSLAYIHRFSL
ncbi:MAG: hypothetical protein RLN96_02260 [Pseudomonadales bacterium]